MDKNTVSEERYPPGYFLEPVMAWWPDFHSDTCDPASPHCVMPHAMKQRMLANAAGAQARAEGRIPGAIIPGKPQPFYWRRVSGTPGCAEQVWDFLQLNPKQTLSLSAAAVLCKRQPNEVKKSVYSAIQAGVLVAVSRRGEDCYRLGDVVPVTIKGRK